MKPISCALCDQKYTPQLYTYGLDSKFCSKCYNKGLSKYWICSLCRKVQKDFVGRMATGYCRQCSLKRNDGKCYECNTPVVNPTRRNIGYGELNCDNCLLHCDEITFGDPIVSTHYEKIGSKRFFGCELETSRSNGTVRVVKETQWGFYHDGSISGLEFTSPPLQGNSGHYAIRKFCKIARENGYRVNRECGFHLHVAIPDYSKSDIDKLCLAYHLTYPIWKKIVSSSRLNNGYCAYKPEIFCAKTLKLNNSIYRDHCYWISIENVECYGTVEIRLHQGTLSPKKIINWVRMHTRFIDWVKRHSLKQVTDEFINHWLVSDNDSLLHSLSKIWRSDRLKTYVLERSTCLKN